MLVSLRRGRVEEGTVTPAGRNLSAGALAKVEAPAHEAPLQRTSVMAALADVWTVLADSGALTLRSLWQSGRRGA